MKLSMLTRRSLQFGLAGILLTGALGLVGCGGSGDSGKGSYPDPTDSITTTKTANALIEPATLKQWIDEGKVNNESAALDRVVIVTVGTAVVIAYEAPQPLAVAAVSQPFSPPLRTFRRSFGKPQ